MEHDKIMEIKYPKGNRLFISFHDDSFIEYSTIKKKTVHHWNNKKKLKSFNFRP